MNNTPRFDQRFVVDLSSGKRASRRTVTTIKSGRAAFGNAEMRTIFKGAK